MRINLPHSPTPVALYADVAVLGEIRATASAEQEASTSTKLGVILRFGPYTLAFFIQRQYIAQWLETGERERFSSLGRI